MPRQLRIEYEGTIYHLGGQRRETAEEKAGRIVAEELDARGWSETELARRPKGDAEKVRMAQRLRRETSVTLKWLAARLRMGSWSHVSNLLSAARKEECKK